MITLKAAAALPQVPRDQRASPGARWSVVRSQRIETMFAASLSAGAAAIHLAAASSHLEALGDLALGFYWAALFQIAFAGALLAHPSSRRLATVGVAINVALVAAWAWSRTIGLPTIPGGPEAVGLADATTVAFQVVLVWMLARRLGMSRTSRGDVAGRPCGVARSPARRSSWESASCSSRHRSPWPTVSRATAMTAEDTPIPKATAG